MRIFERFGGILGLSVLCQLSAATLIVILPWVMTEADEGYVIDIHGNRVKVAPYTADQKAGQQVYWEGVCWHCHSQFVRPVNDEDKRWGPVTQAGESSIDRPHLFGTRRIGPDLAREGGNRNDDWRTPSTFTEPISPFPRRVWATLVLLSGCPAASLWSVRKPK